MAFEEVREESAPMTLRQPLDMPQTPSEEPAYDADDADDDENPDDSFAELLAGDPGSRLLDVLSQLSSRLGNDSRFSHAAGLLHHDVQSLRAQSQESNGSRDLEFANASTMRNSGVINSMHSMLRLLDDAALDLPRSVPSDRAETLTEALVGTGGTPASPKAVQDLLEVAWREVLHREGAENSSSRSCPICLEQLPDVALQMPCSQGHLFHRPCLLEWLAMHNSCPVCRHELPTEEEEPSVDGERMD